MSAARTRDRESNDPAALASIIEINRKAIDDGWEELERLTRLLETLTRDGRRPMAAAAQAGGAVELK